MALAKKDDTPVLKEHQYQFLIKGVRIIWLKAKKDKELCSFPLLRSRMRQMSYVDDLYDLADELGITDGNSELEEMLCDLIFDAFSYKKDEKDYNCYKPKAKKMHVGPIHGTGYGGIGHIFNMIAPGTDLPDTTIKRTREDEDLSDSSPQKAKRSKSEMDN